MITEPTRANLKPFTANQLQGLGTLWTDGEPLEGEQPVVVVPAQYWDEVAAMMQTVKANLLAILERSKAAA